MAGNDTVPQNPDNTSKDIPVIPEVSLNSKFMLPEADDYKFNKNIHPGVSDDLRSKFGPQFYADEIPNLEKKRAAYQSWVDQTGNFIAQSIGEIIGGTIQGIGATGGIINYMATDNQEDFNNFVTDMGSDLLKWSEKNFPIYRTNPDKAFDVTDFGWWASNGVSIASTLSLLIPATGTVKAIGFLGKAARIADEVINVERGISKLKAFRTAETLAEDGIKVGSQAAGKGAEILDTIGQYGAQGLAKGLEFGRKLYNPGEAVKYWSKLAVGAAVARNAENFRESSEVFKNTKEELLENWTNDPEEFDKAKSAEIAKEFAETGKDLTPENLAEYIASKSAWVTYGLNSVNVIFDMMQLSPILKGFNPSTRLGSLATGSLVREAQAEAVSGAAKSLSYGKKLLIGFNPIVSGVGRSATEGIEEAINYIAQKEGESYSNRLLNKDNSTFGSRIGRYLQDAHLYESAFWGAIGGVAFEGATNLSSKILNKFNGVSGNTSRDNRISEISSRAQLITDASNSIKDIESSDELSPYNKKQQINQIKSELSLDLALRAAQVGNVDLLIDQVSSPEYKKKLLETGIASEEDVEKAIFNTKKDILIAESLYKQYYNKFYTRNTSDLVKASLINHSVITDFHISKTKERIDQIKSEIEILKSNDPNFVSKKDSNLESTIYLRSLERAEEAIESMLNSTDFGGILSKRGESVIRDLTSEINILSESLGKDKANLDDINRDIIEKTAQVILLDTSRKLYAQKLNDLSSEKTIKSIENKIESQFKESKKSALEDFKKNLDDEIENGLHTSESLMNLKKENKGDNQKVAYLNGKIEQLRNQEEKNKRESSINTEKDQSAKEGTLKWSSLPKEDIFALNKLADKITDGKTEFDESELQLQSNYPRYLEELLNRRKEEVVEEPVNIPEDIVYNYEIKDLDLSKIDLRLKNVMDGLFEVGNIEQLNGFVGLEKVGQVLEAQYAKNLIMKWQEKKNDSLESNIINEQPRGEEISSTPEIIEINNDIKVDNLLDNSLEVANSEDDNSRAYIPLFDGKQNLYSFSNGNVTIDNNYVQLYKNVTDSNLNVDSEVEISVDLGNKFYSELNKNSSDNIPIKITYNNKIIGYLGTIDAINNSLNIAYSVREIPVTQLSQSLEISTGLKKQFIQQRIDNEISSKGTTFSTTISDIENNLSAIKKIRQYINADSNIKLLTKITEKTNGFLVELDREVPVVQSISNPDIRIAKAGSLDNHTAISLKNNKSEIVEQDLKQGKIYALIDSPTGKTAIPLRLNKIDGQEADKIISLIDDLFIAFSKGSTINSQLVKDIKDKIAQIIKVDTIADDKLNKEPSFRVDVSQDGSPRIEIGYTKSDGKYLAVVKPDKVHLFFDGKPITSDRITYKSPLFKRILLNKYRNVNFNLLQENKSYNNYETYEDYLINEVLTTNIGKVVDGKGNNLGNFFGFNNSLSIKVSSDIYIEPSVENNDTNSDIKEKDKIENKVDIRSNNLDFDALFSPKSNPDVTLNFNNGEKESALGNFSKNYSLFNGGRSTLKETMEEILRNPTSETIRVGASLILNNINKNNPYITYEVSSILNPAAYFPTNNFILLNSALPLRSERKFQNHMVHEGIHALTANIILKYVKNQEKAFTYTDELSFKDDTPLHIKEAITELYNEYKKAYKKAAIENNIWNELPNMGLDYYGFSNIYEFIAETVSNENFNKNLTNSKKGNFIERIIKAIVNFIKKIFNVKESSVNHIEKIVKLIESVDEVPEVDKENIALFNQQEKYFLTRQDKQEVVNTLRGIALTAIRKNIFVTDESSENKIQSLKEHILKGLKNFVKNPNIADQTIVNTIILEFDSIWDDVKRNISRNFNIDESTFDIKDYQEIRKDWEDNASQLTSSKDTITNQIKMFVMTIPNLISNDVKIQENGVITYIPKRNDRTGLTEYLDFNTIYPFMVRSLIGSITENEILDRLQDMSKVHPSFSLMAMELKKDSNLLAQFKSQFHKYPYDSNVTFLYNMDYGLEVRTDNEAKKTRADITIADKWVNAINILSDTKYNTPESRQRLRDHLVSNYYNNILSLKDKFSENSSVLTELIKNFANDIGIDLSDNTILRQISKIRNWDDFTIYSNLDYIARNMVRGIKNEDFGNILSLANLEKDFRIDLVENSALNIEGKNIYTIRSPHYISNWFNLSKSETKEGREEFENILLNYAKEPSNQFSNWLWNDKNQEGLLNYTVQEDKKIPNGVNWNYVAKFSFHNMGGAKELISKEAQKYEDYSDNDYKLINLIGHLYGSKKKGMIQVPMLIPSDSATMYTLEVAKIPLQSGEFNGKYLSRKSLLWNSVYRTVFQEIRRIQTATNQIFKINNGILNVDLSIDPKYLQQYYHYQNIVRDKDGNIDWNNTLIKNGKPTGKVFDFQNMLIKNNDIFNLIDGSKNKSLISLNDINGIKINGVIEYNTLDNNAIETIKKFVDEFIKQGIEQEIQENSFAKEILKGKYEHIGSFEDFIAEYFINQYINNVEQYNFFNGLISEYKSKIDTNKRAKQMTAPGTGLATFAMWWKDSNNNSHSGEIFRAATIKDIKLTSKTIDTIISGTAYNLINEKKYSKQDIDSISTDKKRLQILKIDKENLNELQKDILKVVQSYIDINSGDAQGYVSVQRYINIIKGLGRWNSQYENLFGKILKGEKLSSEEIISISPLKGFYYGRGFDPVLGRYTSNQIKYSTLPLISQLIKGTDLEILSNKMQEDNIDEVFFESAHKVGARIITDISDGNGGIDVTKLKNIVPYEYFNKNWQLQLDVPEHLVDAENLLATQISKIIIANLNEANVYNIDGKSMLSKDLIQHYHRLLSTNIEESADRLLKDLGVELNEDGEFYIPNKEKLYKVLIAEVERRGLSENYKDAIELDEYGKFKLPLFSNNNSNKWESILTSLFTNRVVKQKMPGASLVLASNLFFNDSKEQSEYSGGIEWSSSKKDDKTLYSYRTAEDGKEVQVVEVLMGTWSKKFFNGDERISIDDIPDEIKTMIGYRIPTQAKHSMVVFKVVGLLPEEAKGMIVMPNDIVAQMGSDFDIDKLFIIIKNFSRDKNTGEITIPKYKETFTEEELKESYKLQYGNSKAFLQYMDNLIADEYEKVNKSTGDEAIDKVINALNDFFPETFNDSEINDILEESGIEDGITLYNKVRDKAKQLPSFEDFKSFNIEEQNSRRARENRIFDIYKAILTHKEHLKEIFTPAEFTGFQALKKEIESIFKTSDESINPNTPQGQRTFRTRNIGGRALKGIAANYNAFGAVAQNTKMYLDTRFTFRFDLSVYDKSTLESRYQDNVRFDNGYAVIDFYHLGYAPDNSFLNVDGNLILEHASQGIGAAVDIVKDPTFDAFNGTTYTYPTFHTMLLTGIPDRLAGMFIRQPIIKALNDYYFENKSLLGDGTGNEIEIIKRYYQTILYKTLVDSKRIQPIKKYDKVISRRTSMFDMTPSNLIYMLREETEKILEYDPNNLKYFSVEELKNNLVLESKGFNKLTNDEKINYLVDQLYVIELFNNYKKAGEATQDMIKATKVDGIGAGPSMTVTIELLNHINKTAEDSRILIEDVSALRKVYPQQFGYDSESVYPILNTYLNSANKLSYMVLNNLFIQYSNSYREIIRKIGSYNRSPLNETQIRSVIRYLNFINIQNESIDSDRLIGIDSEVKVNLDINIEEFKKLSFANKAFILKQRDSSKLVLDVNNILNFITPLIEKSHIEENGYHKIDFIQYKDEFKDDYLADSIRDMLNSSDEFQSDFANDLINYSLVTTGLTFGFNSLSKVIPNDVLIDRGFGNYLYEIQALANQGVLFDSNTIDEFYRNNWNNSDIVPRVYTKYQRDENRKVKMFTSDDGMTYPLTVKGTPVWNDVNGVLTVFSSQLKNVDLKIVSSPYILISNFIREDGKMKEVTKLFKKFEVNKILQPKELGKKIQYTYKLSDPLSPNKENLYTDTDELDRIYYYQIDKLGKDGIIEQGTTSFESNRSGLNSVELANNIYLIIDEILTKKVNDLSIVNTSKKDRDNDIKNCNY